MLSRLLRPGVSIDLCGGLGQKRKYGEKITCKTGESFCNHLTLVLPNPSLQVGRLLFQDLYNYRAQPSVPVRGDRIDVYKKTIFWRLMRFFTEKWHSEIRSDWKDKRFSAVMSEDRLFWPSDSGVFKLVVVRTSICSQSILRVILQQGPIKAQSLILARITRGVSFLYYYYYCLLKIGNLQK